MLPDALDKPIYIKLKKGKARKRRYSKGFKGLQRTGRHLTKATIRMSRATTDGMDAFRKAADKSAGKKKDGAIRDLPVNLAKALRKSLRASSRLPVDVARAFDTPASRRATRRQIRALSRVRRVLWR